MEKKVFAYCATDRNHGNRIVLIGNYFYNLLAHCSLFELQLGYK
jgi:hypothetical protein